MLALAMLGSGAANASVIGFHIGPLGVGVGVHDRHHHDYDHYDDYYDDHYYGRYYHHYYHRYDNHNSTHYYGAGAAVGTMVSGHP